MNKEINELREKFKKYNIDGYVVPKNDDYFTEYSKINRLKIISNFSGSAGLAIILKDKNYLFTDGRYTIQSEMESGKYFKIVSYEKIINCKLFKNLRLGLDPKLFTQQQIKNYFLKNNQIKFLSNNLIDEIKNSEIFSSVIYNLWHFDLNPSDIDDETFPKYLDTYVLPDPDLVIRTSGEARISNFLLWQSAYSEYEFVNTLWPDFTAQEFAEILARYGLRERRFGGVTA